jgi:glycosyltransferase involved in cell wall biosynthesis
MKRVLMLCTAARGGMRAVVEGYRRDGLFSAQAIELVTTHAEGSVLYRLRLALIALVQVFLALTQGNVGLLHIHMAMRGSFWRKSIFAALARRFGVPVLLHLHGSEFELFYAQQGRWRQRLICRRLALASGVVVLSDSWARFVRTLAPTARVTVLPNYVPMPPAISRMGGLGKPVSFLFLGLLGHRKGVFDLLPAFAQVLASCPGARLVLGGNGEVEQARQQAEALGIAQHVHFAGWVDGDTKTRLLAEADVFVLPSHNEGLPVAILEAMAVALPVLSTRVGGIPELVREGQDGLLVNAGDQQALAAAMVTLALDDAGRSRMGAAGAARVHASYSDAVILPKLVALYDQLRVHATPGSTPGAGPSVKDSK